MITFMTMIYIAVVVLIFKVFKVRPRPWPIAMVVGGGVLLIGTIVVLWTLAAPMSGRVVVTRYVIQLVPYVKGEVISSPAPPNVPLKKGDVLYKVDPTPYQATVDQLKAQLEATKSSVLQAEAGVDVAEANIKKAEADVTAKKTDFDVAVTIDKENPQAIAKLKLVQAEQTYAAAQAALEEAKASELQAKIAVTTAKETVKSVAAQLEGAQFDLNECTATAPSDGYVTDWQIQKGTFVVPIRLAAVGAFVDTSETNVVASFPAEELIHVQPGQEVEMAFNSKPGCLYRGQVDNVIEATGEGQFYATGKLPSAAAIGSHGFLAVKIRLDNPKDADELPLGAAGTVAIYTDWGKPFHCISKVTVRIKKWLYFLPLPVKP